MARPKTEKDAQPAGATGGAVEPETDGRGEYWRWCPRCGHELHNQHCRLVCPRCLYFMSCSDFD